MCGQERRGPLESKLVFLSIYSLSRGLLKPSCVKGLMLQPSENKGKVGLPVACAPSPCRDAGAKQTSSAFQIGPGLNNREPQATAHANIF